MNIHMFHLEELFIDLENYYINFFNNKYIKILIYSYKIEEDYNFCCN